MKKIIYLFIAISISSYSQDFEKKTSIESSDFYSAEGRTNFKEKTFYFKNGSNEYVPVITSIFMSDEKFKEITIAEINDMILVSNEKIPYNIKNRYTYIPREIRIDFVEKENEWRVIIDYTAQNDYGATKDGYSFVNFNNDGTFKNIVNF